MGSILVGSFILGLIVGTGALCSTNSPKINSSVTGGRTCRGTSFGTASIAVETLSFSLLTPLLSGFSLLSIAVGEGVTLREGVCLAVGVTVGVLIGVSSGINGGGKTQLPV
jgi:hypothetical protein